MTHQERSAMSLCIEPVCVHACINTLCIRLLMKSSLESNYASLNLGWNWNLKIRASLKHLRVTAVLLHAAMHNAHILCMFGDQTFSLFFFNPTLPLAVRAWHCSVFSCQVCVTAGQTCRRRKTTVVKHLSSSSSSSLGTWEGFTAVTKAEECDLATGGVCTWVRRDVTDVVFLAQPPLPPHHHHSSTPSPPSSLETRLRIKAVKSLRASPVLLDSVTHENLTKAVSNWWLVGQN